jgi:hypothetical protein
MASAPIRLSGASPRAARPGAATAKASCESVSRCQPNAAPFVVATLRASSLAASGVAPTMSTSSPADRPSSHARARRIRRSFAAETMAFALISRMSRRLVGMVVRLPCYSFRPLARCRSVAAHERFHLPGRRTIGLFDHRLANARTPSGLAMRTTPSCLCGPHSHRSPCSPRCANPTRRCNIWSEHPKGG